MTEQPLSSSNQHLDSQTGFAFSRRVSPEFCASCRALLEKGRREGRVLAGTRGPLREMHTQEEPHSSIQVKPNTRPSLRDGRTAYAVLLCLQIMPKNANGRF
ncbi:hypothetical protein DAA51_06760 [Bradyrhizobium sp. WBAH10]|nr:hypothetical protein [Bradyrhizobium sp. WBAH30]MDD1543839.1 hypothetical protein [Bradyrhizobium sp. WBAH41]MDD1557876.1 hypothetical protein [Bradyrhizobium sp. WBAH23]MDD1565289.1 hypothetical protein [Bradyrhizobium sp. WBAH33]MDD1592220.1 hypothetical protein [Bradyrhizobium sp. WBAH42]NRB88401.1 hypothetical protein [Bradyrhizobium sp. WBAH10]QCJ88437.1 hypothetical protein DAA57_07880 [Bradyrhizobium yuanmingense]